MKQPRLRVQARGAHVIRHADVRPELAERIQGPSFCRPRIGRRQDAQLTTVLTMVAKRVEERRDTASANERHHQVDAIG